MKILIVGAAGTIGKAVAEELGQRHEIVGAGRDSGSVAFDMTDPASVKTAFAAIGTVDAVVVAAGAVTFKPLPEMSPADYLFGLQNKVMGQVNVVLGGLPRVADGGSFTLTTGVLDHDPIRAGSGASMANGAINAWVAAAAIEMPRGIRINVVSPGLLEESEAALGSFFPGHIPVPGRRVARAYAKSVEGAQTGQVYSVL